MKILHAVFGGTWGGCSVVVHDICRKLVERGDDVSVLALDAESERRFREIGVRPIRIRGWRRTGLHPMDAVLLFEVWRLCRRERFDLVITHTSKGGVIGRLGAWLAGTPRVLHMSHGYYFKHVGGFARRVYIWVERFAANFCHGTICVSNEHREAAILEGVESPERIRTVYNGIDLRRHGSTDRAAARAGLGFADDDVVVGVLGRIDPSKGLDESIEALPAILARHPRVRFVIIGDGPYRQEVAARAERLGVAERVQFLGFRADVPDVLGALDIFVQPSYREGLSVAVMEAMAARLPIVATDIVGNREQVFHERTGLLVPVRDAAALAAGVNRLLDDPALAARLGAKAREFAETHFDTQLMVEGNIAIYDELTRGARPLDGPLLGPPDMAGGAAGSR